MKLPQNVIDSLNAKALKLGLLGIGQLCEVLLLAFDRGEIELMAIQKEQKKKAKKFSFSSIPAANCFQTLSQECEVAKLANNVNPEQFERLYLEFQQKLPPNGMSNEVKKIVLYQQEDKKKDVSTLFVRNWLVRTVERAKTASRTQVAAVKDKIHTAESLPRPKADLSLLPDLAKIAAAKTWH